MQITRFGPDDHDSVLAQVELGNAVRAHDTPWVHPTTLARTVGSLRHGWDGEPGVPYLATDDGVPVAIASYDTSVHDNQHVAWFDVDVHPDHRGRGVGSAVLAHLLDVARADNKTSVGISCWDTPFGFDAFALKHGFEQKAVGVNRRQHLAEVDPDVVRRLHEEALTAAGDYEVVRTLGRSDDDQLDSLAVLTSAINDAPKEGLEIEDQVFTGERIRAYEDAQTGRGDLLHRVVARHRATGELAGQSLVAVDGERPQYAEQHDTSVVAAHRGHRLGALLKTDMLLWLAETQPQITEIDTWNAESNSFMIGVNEQLGYRVVGRGLDLQRSL